MDQLLQDLRYSVRTLMRNRVFTTIAVLCLALGIGVNTAIFSVVRGMLFRPLPFDPDGRLTTVWATNERRGIEDSGVSFADLQDIRSSGVFDRIEGLTGRSFTLTAADQPERVEGAAITPGLFDMIGARPQQGRLFRLEEAAPAGFEQVVLISDGLWKRSFGADPEIVGRAIHINARQLVVVGVMPPEFKFPETNEIWVPLGAADATNRQSRSIWAFGRLKSEGTLSAAAAQLAAIAAGWKKTFPQTHRDWSLRALSYRDSVVDPNAQKLMFIMMGAVAFVLMIACANVANLLLARASDREREIALRAALGASRARVLRQLLTESVLLALVGGVAGILISVWWVDAMMSTIPEELPYWLHFSVDGSVLVYTIAISIATGLLFGLMPALQAARGDLQTNLREGSRGQTRAQNRLRNTLVVGEIALSMILLVGAGLMVQSFLKLQAASPGFDTERLLTFRLTLAGDQYDPLVAKANYFQNAAERIAALPGVQAAAVTSSIPADDGGAPVPVVAAGDARATEDAITVTEVADGRGLYGVLGLQLRAGRDFTPQELTDTAARVVILGQRLATRLFPGQDALNRQVRIGEHHLFTVIGIAPDLQYEEFGEETLQDSLQMHVAYAHWGTRGMAFMVRTTGDPNAMQSRIREELRAIDPALAPWDMQTMEQRRLYTTWPQRLFGKSFGTFGATALVLALAGVYGVIAYSVARRRREIGVRIALGARPADVLQLVVGRAALLAGLGVAIGLAGAIAVSGLLRGLIWGVSTVDPLTFIVTPIVLTVAALLASYIPARRATKLDPIVALRSE
jgi:putative ABC transport system permease protein